MKEHTHLLNGRIETPSSTPVVSIAIAEKVLRDIARREGEAIKKRRSRTMIEHYGAGYMVYDPVINGVLSGYDAQDGCGDDLIALAQRYEDCERNTAWQKRVIAAIKANRVKDGLQK